MSILDAMYSGVSGLTAESDALDVIGNNLANTNTIGFKESRAIFENVLGAAVGTEGAVGGGVMMSTAQQIFTEGSLDNTGVPTDVALSGDGFFMVQGDIGGVAGTFYTRAGQTSLNASGTLVNPDGMAFQGYPANATGGFSTTPGPITVGTAALSPKVTTTLTIAANLNSSDVPPTTAWNAQNPGPTSNFSTSMQVYDSLGDAHTMNVYFQNDGGGQWTYHVLANGSEVQGGTAGQNSEIATGTLTFNTNGSLQSNTLTAGGTVSFNGATANQPLTFSFGTPIASGGTGLDGITQFGSPDSVSAQSQDGYASGALSSLSIDNSGVVSGVYTNGQTIAIAQMAVAKFQNDQGLGQAGQNCWTATPDSGAAAVGAAGTGAMPSIVSGSLETSNVDIATQFTDLIAHQRGFEANSKTITTADQMLQDVIAMKQ
ncbi:MAG: flagellar hook protein FlgE [Polyangiaceae bacterium]